MRRRFRRFASFERSRMVTASGGADFYDEEVRIFSPEDILSLYGGCIYAIMKRKYQKIYYYIK